MLKRLKGFALLFCLFTFLLIVLGSGLHLSPGGAFMVAATGTPLFVYAFNRLLSAGSVQHLCRPQQLMSRNSATKRCVPE
jgi:hypothetical protein